MTFRTGAMILAMAGSCTLPSLEELEKQSRSSCDSSRPCATGWHCGPDGLCAQDNGGACNDGDKMVCGTTGGECMQGLQTCSSGRFGTCMGAVGPVQEVCNGKDDDCNGTNDDNAMDAPLCPLRAGVCTGKHAACGATGCDAGLYGPDYEPVETKCDGKDNDCDGGVDTGLFQLCAEQRGECAGARVSCTAGAFPACTPATFSNHDPDFQAFEIACDRKDNDCDGVVDAWNVSSSATGSRNPAAATSSAAPTDLVVLWEEEESGNFKVKSRVVRENNTMTPVASPSATASAAVHSWAPAIAGDGTELVASWAEEVTIGGAKRIALVSLDAATGVSKLTGMGALAVLSGADVNQPTEVAIAVDSVAQRLLVAVIDGNSLTLVRAQLPIGLTSPVPDKNIASAVSHVRLAPAGGGSFWLTWETTLGQVHRCLVDDQGRRNCTMPITAKSPAIAPLTSSAPFGALSAFLVDVDAGVQHVASSTCADGGTCTMGTLPATLPPRAEMSALRLTATARNAQPTFFAWEEGTPSAASFRYVVTNRGDGGVQPGGPSPGRRPQPFFIGTSGGAIVFDTEGLAPGPVPAGEVFVARFCF